MIFLKYITLLFCIITATNKHLAAVDNLFQNQEIAFCSGSDMTCAAVDTCAAQIAHTIGDAKAAGLNKTVGQLAHAGAGALKEQLKGGDPLAGAIGAVVAETIAEGRAQSAGDRALEKTMQAACNADHKLSKAEFDALLKENLDTEMHRCVLTGQLAGVSAAFLAGRDVASADSAGATAVRV